MKFNIEKNTSDINVFSISVDNTHFSVEVTDREFTNLGEAINSLLNTENNESFNRQMIRKQLDKLSTIDLRGFQTLLRELDSQTLIVTMVLCGKYNKRILTEKVYRSLSKRAGEMLRDDTEESSKRPLSVDEATNAISKFLDTAGKMTDTGLLCFIDNPDEWIN